MKITVFLISLFCCIALFSQPAGKTQWTKDGNGYYQQSPGKIVKISLPSQQATTVVDSGMLTPAGQRNPLPVENFFFSADGNKMLIYTNSQRVWRYNTRGDYWVLDLATKSLKQIGKDKPVASLMFAKFSPDGNKVAYVSGHNIYVEEVASGTSKALTTDGTDKLINGTFDWAYEEEFFCRDGFRWSPDGQQIAYWQIDARNVKSYLMLNTTDSIYPFTVPVEYPIAGEAPSPFKIGVVNVASAITKWMNIPTDAVLQSYVPRMEWAANSTELIVQHLNRKQNQSDIMLCNVSNGTANTIYSEKDSAWIDIQPLWDEDYQYGGWDWLADGKEFMWASEKDGWRHLYRISRDGKKEMLITKGAYDVMDICALDEKSGYVYFFASPTNATQKYLYRTKLDGSGTAQRLSPQDEPGTHDYDVSPTGTFAFHQFSNAHTASVSDVVKLPDHTIVQRYPAPINRRGKPLDIRFFTVTTPAGITMDAWKVMPTNFDSTKKYPVVFYVYTEPWGQNVKDQWGIGRNRLYRGNMQDDGYIYVSIDNRGTPVPKGRAWRKSIYRKIGIVNIDDQAAAAQEILKWKYADTSRVAVWGWSGGGSATLNLMFRYPQIYKTGIAVAAVGNQLTYDNIYQERYMGLPQEAREDFVKGSPITYAKNLRGNLLYIHGTGDDNVHYNNAEMLINELIKNGKQFQLMSYPNRTHGIYEGAGTSEHLATLFTNYLREHCAPGGR